MSEANRSGSLESRDYRLHDLAIRAARASACRYKFGAVIAMKNRVLSVASNILKTHPLIKEYGSHCISIHAELNAILSAQCDIVGATMYIARSGCVILSRPCKVCLTYICQAEIKYIVYHGKRGLEKVRL